jgi:hypothetical protein
MQRLDAPIARPATPQDSSAFIMQLLGCPSASPEAISNDVTNPGEIILETILRIAHSQPLNLSVEPGEQAYIESHKFWLNPQPGDEFTLALLDKLFIAGNARHVYKALTHFDLTAELFPWLKQEFYDDFSRACDASDGVIAGHPYKDLTTDQLLKMRAQFLAMILYNSFITGKDFWQFLGTQNEDQYITAINDFINHLPFNLQGEEHKLLREEITIISYEYLHEDKLPIIYNDFIGSNQDLTVSDNSDSRDSFILSFTKHFDFVCPEIVNPVATLILEQVLSNKKEVEHLRPSI